MYKAARTNIPIRSAGAAMPRCSSTPSRAGISAPPRARDLLVSGNQQINWVPDHIKNGRFGNWLENNIDWAISRQRYWGTPLPVWECACGHQECVGSIAELSEKAGEDLSDLDLHRPYVDEITWTCAKCGGEMRRVPDLMDVWFDSGAMPLAQWHYPFENQELFEKAAVADYICEAVDQTRGWFYTPARPLHPALRPPVLQKRHLPRPHPG